MKENPPKQAENVGKWRNSEAQRRAAFVGVRNKRVCKKIRAKGWLSSPLLRFLNMKFKASIRWPSWQLWKPGKRVRLVAWLSRHHRSSRLLLKVSFLQAFVRFQQRAKLCSWRPIKKKWRQMPWICRLFFESFWVPRDSRETQGKVIWSHRQVNFDRVLRDSKSHSVEHCWAQQNCGCWTTLFRYWDVLSVYWPSCSIALFLGKFMLHGPMVPHLAGVLAWDQDEDVGLWEIWERIRWFAPSIKSNVEQMEEPGKGWKRNAGQQWPTNRRLVVTAKPEDRSWIWHPLALTDTSAYQSSF